MNARTLALLAASSIATSLVAGCSAAPTSESDGSSEEALINPVPGGPGDWGGHPRPRCNFDNAPETTFGDILQDTYNCGAPGLYTFGNGNNFEVSICPDSAGLRKLVSDYQNVAPVYSRLSGGTSICLGSPLGNGRVQVSFDPHCTGGQCSAPTIGSVTDTWTP